MRSRSYGPRMLRCIAAQAINICSRKWKEEKNCARRCNGIKTFTVGLLRCKTKPTHSNNIFFVRSIERAFDNSIWSEFCPRAMITTFIIIYVMCFKRQPQQRNSVEANCAWASTNQQYAQCAHKHDPTPFPSSLCEQSHPRTDQRFPNNHQIHALCSASFCCFMCALGRAADKNTYNIASRLKCKQKWIFASLRCVQRTLNWLMWARVWSGLNTTATAAIAF